MTSASPSPFSWTQTGRCPVSCPPTSTLLSKPCAIDKTGVPDPGCWLSMLAIRDGVVLYSHRYVCMARPCLHASKKNNEYIYWCGVSMQIYKKVSAPDICPHLVAPARVESGVDEVAVEGEGRCGQRLPNHAQVEVRQEARALFKPDTSNKLRHIKTNTKEHCYTHMCASRVGIENMLWRNYIAAQMLDQGCLRLRRPTC